MQYVSAKIVILGDSGVGKTSLRKRYLGEEFNITHFPTLGADYSVMPIKIKNRVTINTNIWDIAGQKGFDFLRQRFLIDTSAAICVFDLTILESLNNISNWIKELREANNQIIMPIVLVGNKSDLTEKRAVSDKDIDNMKNYLIKNEFVSKDGIEYIEASAKTGFNIAEGFNILANEIYNNLKDQN